jgi:hypothetical protein
MKAEEHTKNVGAIVTNIQALETVLKYFLLKVNNRLRRARQWSPADPPKSELIS